jgi:hypothetical protein
MASPADIAKQFLDAYSGQYAGLLKDNIQNALNQGVYRLNFHSRSRRSKRN